MQTEINIHNDDLLSLAKQLIAISSVTPHDNGCQLLLRDRLTAIGFQCESLRFGEVDNLWAKYGKNKPLIVFAGHTDVVPPGPLEAWTSPPFTPSVRDGKLYGRGASDMKAAIAAMIIAVEHFVKQHPDFPGSIGFLLTSDEEGDAVNGTVKVMETLAARGEKIDFCIVGEPSSHEKIADQVRIGRRGSLHCKIRILGKQGHVAHPHLAQNPIHLSAAAIHDLAHTEWDQGNEHYPPTSFQISNMQSGTGALNVIPGHLDIFANFRFSTALTFEKIKERVEAILQKHGLQFEITWHLSAKPFLTTHGELITATQKATQDLTQQTVHLSTGGGTSDGRFIAASGAEVVELGVLHATAHQIDEHVSIQDLCVLAAIYEQILTNLFN